MTKKSIQKNLLLAVILLAAIGLQPVSAQTTPQQIMNRIYEKYDSLSYLTFNVKYIYATDTIGGKYKTDVMKGSYTMAGKKALYNIGDIQFMQNDSFFITVYPDEKYIIVADPRTRNSGSQLPMRAMMDSMIKTYAKHYTIKMTADSVEGTIRFIKADSLAQFDRFIIKYDVEEYYLNSIKYDFEEAEIVGEDEEEDTNESLQTVTRKKSLTLRFTDYRIDNFSPDNYNENNYIWFDEGECKPADKYRGYRIFYSRSGFF